MTHSRRLLGLLAAAPLALGIAGFAHADEAISDTRISSHGAPTQTAPLYLTQNYYNPNYNQTYTDDVRYDDNGRISAHETYPTNPGNTSNYNPPPIYVVTPQPAYPVYPVYPVYPQASQPVYVQPGTPVYVQPGTPYYTQPNWAGPQIQIISNEPYFQDDVPPYRR